MTHEELRAKIDEHIDYGTCGFCDGKCYKEENMPWVALRAVVELHKPDEFGCCTNGCWWLSENGDFNVYEYPCPEIQAIEKELK